MLTNVQENKNADLYAFRKNTKRNMVNAIN